MNYDAAVRVSAKVSGQEQLDKLNKTLKQTGENAGVSAKQTAAAMRTLPAQFTDIVTQLAGGQNPGLILLQQGGQIKDSFGGVGNALKAIGSLVTPARLAFLGLGGAIAAVGFAAWKGADEVEQLNHSILLTGQYAGRTIGQLNAMAQATKDATGNTIGNTRELTAGAVGSGAFGSSTINQAVLAMSTLQKLSGQTSDEVVKDFAAMRNGVAQWAAEHNRQYNFLTYEQYKYIKLLETQGNKEEAMKVTLEALNESIKSRKLELGYLASAWENVKDKASSAWDAMMNVGRPETVEDKISKVQRQLELLGRSMEKISMAPGMTGARNKALLQYQTDALQEQLKELKKQQAAAQISADIKSKAAEAEQKKIDENSSGKDLARENANYSLALELLKAASQKRIDLLKYEFSTTEGLHAAGKISDSAYGKAKLDLEQSIYNAQADLMRKEIALEQSRDTHGDKTAEIQKQTKLVQMRRELATLESEANGSRNQASFGIKNQAVEEFEKQTRAIEAATRALFLNNAEKMDAAIREDLLNKKIAEGTEEWTRLYNARKAAMQAQEATANNWGLGLSQGLEQYAKDAGNVMQNVKNATVSAFKGMEDALVNWVTTGKLQVKSLASSIIADLARIAIQRSITGPLADSLFGSVGKDAAGAGGASFLSWLGGKIFRADGGSVSGGGSYIVGERGPEVFTPNTGGTIIPNHALGGGGNVNSTIVVNINGSTGEATTTGGNGQMETFARMVGAMVNQKFTEAMRPGGMLANRGLA